MQHPQVLEVPLELICSEMGNSSQCRFFFPDWNANASLVGSNHYMVKLEYETQNLSLWPSDEGIPLGEHYSVPYRTLKFSVLLGRVTGESFTI